MKVFDEGFALVEEENPTEAARKTSEYYLFTGGSLLW